MMEAREKARRIRAVGNYIDKTGDLGVRCQGCGDVIHESDVLDDVEYVKTKRHTEFFFHSRCVGNVWKHGIV